MRKIWNQPAWPVWSVSTADATGQQNMNIATYVQAISLQPKQFMVALYHDTKTLDNVRATKECLLQLLPEELAPIVRVCGKHSGNSIDKIARLEKRYELAQYEDLAYLAGAVGFVHLRLLSLSESGGDHTIGIFAVVKEKRLNDKSILTTDYLREHKYIR